MQTSIVILIAAIVLMVFGSLAAWKPICRRRRRPCLDEARRLFRPQREHLEAKFVDLAQAAHDRGIPRWLDCDFDDEVTYVCNRRTGQLAALVAITVTLAGRKSVLDNLPSGYVGPLHKGKLMAPPTGSLRSATAIFCFDGDCWTTEGRAIFNLSPAETLCFYRRDLQIVSQ